MTGRSLESRALALPVVQPGTGDPPGVYVPSTPDTVSWGWIESSAAEPVVTVRSGELVTIDTVSHEGILGDQGRDPVAFFGGHGIAEADVLADAVAIAASGLRHDAAVDGPHIVSGPIAVEGAEPGDVVTVEVVALDLRAPYGVVSNRHGFGALPLELPEPDAVTGEIPEVVCRFARVEWHRGELRAVVEDPYGRGLPLPLRPFLGLTAVAPAGGRVHSVPPGPHGGNLDVRLLGAGSRLHLPVQVPGALVQVGDPHFAQGDGEVALTALEGPLRATLRLHLRKAAAPDPAGPWGETDDCWVMLGLHEDLDEAVRRATRAALAMVVDETGLDRATAYAWLSVAADLSVSQVVDRVKGAHMIVPKHLLQPVPR